MKTPFHFQHIGLKVFSLCVACVLFVCVSLEEPTPVDVTIPLVYDIPKHLTVTSHKPLYAYATLQGSWMSVHLLNTSHMAPIHIDLQHAVSGSLHYALHPSMVAAPTGTHVLALRPSHITLTLLDTSASNRVQPTPTSEDF